MLGLFQQNSTQGSQTTSIGNQKGKICSVPTPPEQHKSLQLCTVGKNSHQRCLA